MTIISCSQKSQWSLCLCAFIFMAEGRVPCTNLTDAMGEFPQIVLDSQFTWLDFFSFFLFTQTPKALMLTDFPSHLNYKSLFRVPQKKPFWVRIFLFLFCTLVDIHDIRIACCGILQQEQNAGCMREPMRSTQRTKWTYPYGRKYISCYRK